MNSQAVSRTNLSALFRKAAIVLFAISYFFGFPWRTLNPSRGQQAMALFGIVASVCWLIHRSYRDKRP